MKANDTTPATVNGKTLDIVVRGANVYVNNTKVVKADIAASNRVIHVIDTVLLPPTASAATDR